YYLPASKNWLNYPSTLIIPYDSSNTSSLSDTSVLKYKGNSFSIPLTLQVHYEFLDRFRAGAGVSLEYHRLPVLTPSRDRDIIGDYVPDKKGTLFTRYFIMAGARIYRKWGWSYFVDAEIGKLNMGSAFNKAAIIKGLYFNLGASMEFEISEYLHAVVRPSFEYKRYTLYTGSGYPVNHQFPAVYLNLGFKYNIPEIPRCPIHSNDPPGIQFPTYPKSYTNRHCRIQKKHFHGDRQFRGQPFYKKQNPEIGENQPVPVRRMLFNRRKLSGGY
ncbi:MAG TPA: hypothetical protein VI583_13180, partial [Cyclobacteriaceae bacterium]|nr:hypothetical protein [Cyclobacteriaceae bacterium]